MLGPLMFWTNVAIDFLLFFFVIDCVLMCLVVLMQRGKQEGLGAAFGGGLMDSTFGAQTSNVLVKTTVILAAIFFILSISLARLYSHRATLLGSEQKADLSVQQDLLKPVAPATPAPSTTTPAPVPVPAPTTSAPTATPLTATPPAPASTNAVAPVAPVPVKPAAK